MKAKNVKEFKALIKRYESITLAEIEEVASDPELIEYIKMTKRYGINIASHLTGFGREDSCSLCLEIGRDCYSCVYGHMYACLDSDKSNTYGRIRDAKTPQRLLYAFKARAKYMKTVLTEYNKQLKK
jgi:hypothetical protein